MLKVAIATNSKDKIAGIKEAFYLASKMADIRFQSCKAHSGVPEQPFNSETYQGAQNRVDEIRNLYDDVSFYVSCEAGIEKCGGHYFNVQIVCIFDVWAQDYLWGKSSGWFIPSEDIALIRKIGLDEYLKAYKNISSITELIGCEYSRARLVKEATLMALGSGKLC